MSALDTLVAILDNQYLVNARLKYCLHKSKIPYSAVDELIKVKPNSYNDFVDLSEINLQLLNKFDGLGISIQASNVAAIDIDHCFETAFDINSIDERGLDILNIFKNETYVEFSYSGTGLRILFKPTKIENYCDTYYIKNSKTQCECYFPEITNRYVTITGKVIIQQDILPIDENVLFKFLDKYMKKNINNTLAEKPKKSTYNIDTMLRFWLFKDFSFRSLWFSIPSGFNGNESECDFYLLKFIKTNISNNKEEVKKLFESSYYFKHKDKKHIAKWKYNNYRYFNYIWEHI